MAMLLCLSGYEQKQQRIKRALMSPAEKRALLTLWGAQHILTMRGALSGDFPHDCFRITDSNVSRVHFLNRDSTLAWQTDKIAVTIVAVTQWVWCPTF